MNPPAPFLRTDMAAASPEERDPCKRVGKYFGKYRVHKVAKSYRPVDSIVKMK